METGRSGPRGRGRGRSRARNDARNTRENRKVRFEESSNPSSPELRTQKAGATRASSGSPPRRESTRQSVGDTPGQRQSSQSSTASLAGGPNTYQHRFDQLKAKRQREQHGGPSGATVHLARTPKGECPDMCPEMERLERILGRDVWAPERSLDGQPDESRMVKKFRRSAAGTEEQTAHDLRPPEVLQKTIEFLCHEVITDDSSFPKVHLFIWDRTRAIRNDYSIQQVSKPQDLRMAIATFERIARFHIASIHLLAMPPPQKAYPSYDLQQEIEQLDKTLYSLMTYYEQCRNRQIDIPNEAEFVSYTILLAIRRPVANIDASVGKHSAHIRQDLRVRKALSLYHAATNITSYKGPLKPSAPIPVAQSDWQKWWRVIEGRGVSFLMGCLCELFFNQIRKVAITALIRSFKQPGANRDFWTAFEFAAAIGLRWQDPSDNEEARLYIDHYGLSIKANEHGEEYTNPFEARVPTGGFAPLNRDPVPSYIVTAKRYGRSIAAVIDGISVSEAIQAGMVSTEHSSGADMQLTPKFLADEDSLFLPDAPDVSKKFAFESFSQSDASLQADGSDTVKLGYDQGKPQMNPQLNPQAPAFSFGQPKIKDFAAHTNTFQNSESNTQPDSSEALSTDASDTKGANVQSQIFTPGESAPAQTFGPTPATSFNFSSGNQNFSGLDLGKSLFQPKELMQIGSDQSKKSSFAQTEQSNTGSKTQSSSSDSVFKTGLGHQNSSSIFRPSSTSTQPNFATTPQPTSKQELGAQSSSYNTANDTTFWPSSSPDAFRNERIPPQTLSSLAESNTTETSLASSVNPTSNPAKPLLPHFQQSEIESRAPAKVMLNSSLSSNLDHNLTPYPVEAPWPAGTQENKGSSDPFLFNPETSHPSQRPFPSSRQVPSLFSNDPLTTSSSPHVSGDHSSLPESALHNFKSGSLTGDTLFTPTTGITKNSPRTKNTRKVQFDLESAEQQVQHRHGGQKSSAQDPHVQSAESIAKSRQLHQDQVLQNLSRQLVTEQFGLLEQYIEFVATDIIRRAYSQVQEERTSRRANEFRQRKLRERYGRKWKDIHYAKVLREKGKRRRRRRHEDVEALAQSQLKQSQRAGIGIHPSRPQNSFDSLVSASIKSSDGNQPSRTSILDFDRSGSTDLKATPGSVNEDVRPNLRSRIEQYPIKGQPKFAPESTSATLQAITQNQQSNLNSAGLSTHGRPSVRDTTRSPYFRRKIIESTVLGDKRVLPENLDVYAHSWSSGYDHSSQRHPYTPSSSQTIASDSQGRQQHNQASSSKQDIKIGLTTATQADEELFQEIAKVRAAMDESISFFKDETAKEMSRQSQSLGNSPSEGPDLKAIRGSDDHHEPIETLERSRSRSVIETGSDKSGSKRHLSPLKYRSRQSKFLSRDQYADMLLMKRKREDSELIEPANVPPNKMRKSLPDTNTNRGEQTTHTFSINTSAGPYTKIKPEVITPPSKAARLDTHVEPEVFALSSDSKNPTSPSGNEAGKAPEAPSNPHSRVSPFQEEMQNTSQMTNIFETQNSFFNTELVSSGVLGQPSSNAPKYNTNASVDATTTRNDAEESAPSSSPPAPINQQSFDSQNPFAALANMQDEEQSGLEDFNDTAEETETNEQSERSDELERDDDDWNQGHPELQDGPLDSYEEEEDTSEKEEDYSDYGDEEINGDTEEGHEYEDFVDRSIDLATPTEAFKSKWGDKGGTSADDAIEL